MLQFPPWFPISRARKDYILACAQRAAPRRVCVEFRNRTGMTPENQEENLEFLAARQLPYAGADMCSAVDHSAGTRSTMAPVRPWFGLPSLAAC